MNLTAEQIKNLNILADFMDGLDDPNFTMLRYQHECGTPACAFGWACTVPALREKGLRSDLVYEPSWRWPNMSRVFGGDSFELLFSHDLYGRIKTPQQWAAHCRAFLKSHGYEVSDGFKTFMERVMIPLDTKELQGETQ